MSDAAGGRCVAAGNLPELLFRDRTGAALRIVPTLRAANSRMIESLASDR